MPSSNSSESHSDVAENPVLYGTCSAPTTTASSNGISAAPAHVYDTPPRALASRADDVAENPLVYGAPSSRAGGRGRAGPEYDIPPPAPTTLVANDYRDSVREMPPSIETNTSLGYLDIETGEEVVDEGPIEPLYDDGEDGDALDSGSSGYDASQVVTPAPRGLVRDASWRVMFGDQRRRSSVTSSASASGRNTVAQDDDDEGC